MCIYNRYVGPIYLYYNTDTHKNSAKLVVGIYFCVYTKRNTITNGVGHTILNGAPFIPFLTILHLFTRAHLIGRRIRP